jgi:hypothetical protein
VRNIVDSRVGTDKSVQDFAATAHGVTLKRVLHVRTPMDGADRFMFWGLVLLTLVILLGFVLALVGV